MTAIPLRKEQFDHSAGAASIARTLEAEAAAIRRAASIACQAAAVAAEAVARCQGCVVVTGVGKAGLIGQKLVATLGSTGSPAHFLHPSEAVHGDLGRVRDDDLVMALSNSGRSEEILRIVGDLADRTTGLIAITANESNPLANAATHVVPIGQHTEACQHALAPSSSTAAMLAVGDAIALRASELRGFTADDFARHHPGGALGRKLSRVEEMMRHRDQCRIAKASLSVRDAIADSGSRRCGAVMIVEEDGRLAGIFTDSDLARLLQQRRDVSLDSPVSGVMTGEPICVRQGEMLATALEVLSRHRISELPVVDSFGTPVGMIDITDLIAAGMMHEEATEWNQDSGASHRNSKVLPFRRLERS
ncbi:MAG: KpsF/GutQ family sugar-phosphate isomerase [Planctomycetota bacterium]